jgi:drug/metabolite transporter (DMT)-like permease
VKSLGRTDSSVTITAYMSLLITPIALIPALFVWQWPNAEQLAWLVAIGILGNIGQILMAQALKEAPTHVVMPFDFLKLVWVSSIAYFAFAEVPDVFTWVGAAMIVTSAATIAYRERRQSNRT